MSNKPIDGKEKGSRFEREICADFSRWTGVPWDRTFRSGGGKVKGDIAPVNGSSIFCVELKRREKWSLEDFWYRKGEAWNWWTKLCKEAREGDQHPLLIAKRSRKEAVAVLDWFGEDKVIRGHLIVSGIPWLEHQGVIVVPYSALMASMAGPTICTVGS